MAKLSQILSSKQGVDLEFVDLIQDETRGGDPLVRLVLRSPIPAVFGRQVTDPLTDDRVRLEANDVEMVSIGKEALDAIDELEEKGETPITWNVEGKSGHIKCNLGMDVSNALEVWIVKTKFSTFSANQRNNRRINQRSNLVNKIREAKTKTEFKETSVGDGKPEVVTQN